MVEQHVTVDFDCCFCGSCVSVTVRCEGKGPGGAAGVAAVNVPCPTCNQVNRLYFEPGGALRRVRPYPGGWPLPAPSAN
jgi:hypothetical protein